MTLLCSLIPYEPQRDIEGAKNHLPPCLVLPHNDYSREHFCHSPRLQCTKPLDPQVEFFGSTLFKTLTKPIPINNSEIFTTGRECSISSLWIAAPVQGTGYQFPQVREQVWPVGRTGHQSQVKEQVSYLSQEQVTDFGWNLSENSFLYVSLMVLKPLLYWLQVTTTLDLTLSRQTRELMLKGTQTTEAVSSLFTESALPGEALFVP